MGATTIHPSMAKSAIEWTESTWNPVTGSTKVSPGCKHCYAKRMAKRLRAMGQPLLSALGKLDLDGIHWAIGGQVRSQVAADEPRVGDGDLCLAANPEDFAPRVRAEEWRRPRRIGSTTCCPQLPCDSWS
jgi:hypothetical protein